MTEQLNVEEIINKSRSIIGSSYDLASGGIPPHANMLEQIVEGKKMGDYERTIFLSMDVSNLLAIPGITLYLDEETREEAVDYFGRETADGIQEQKTQLRQLAVQGTNAVLRHHFYPESPWNFDSLSSNEVASMIQEAANKGYLPGIRSSFREWKPPEWSERDFSSVMDFVLYLFHSGAEWTKEGLDAVSKANDVWFSEPLYSRAIGMYAQKLGLMNQLLRHATRKANELGFADVKVFNPATYFESHKDTPVSQWEESFQKYFGKSVPGALGLLEWSEKVLKRVEERAES